MARRLVVCADGTWNTPTQEDEGKLSPTNVVKLYEAVRRRPVASDGTSQLAYYHEGVGTKPNVLERGVEHVADFLHLHSVGRNLFEGATGDGLDRNIVDCYRWLVRTYQPGDSLYLFGFSRGAYTVRSLAGLIRNSGLLTQDDDALVAKAFALYRDRSSDSAPASDQAVAFRRLYAFDVDVTCLGVWDTVGALGIPIRLFGGLNAALYGFHDLTLSSHVGYAFHALAIDEQRRPFAPTLWEQQPRAADAGQVLEQVWFAGVHSNVGGGYADCGLSDTAFLWMVDAVKRAGLEVDHEYVNTVVCHACWDGDLRDSMGPPFDVLAPYVRPIAEGRSADDDPATHPDARRETVHPSAIRRLGQAVPAGTAPYAPDNLADYVHRFPGEVELDRTDPHITRDALAGSAAGP